MLKDWQCWFFLIRTNWIYDTVSPIWNTIFILGNGNQIKFNDLLLYLEKWMTIEDDLCFRVHLSSILLMTTAEFILE